MSFLGFDDFDKSIYVFGFDLKKFFECMDCKALNIKKSYKRKKVEILLAKAK